MFSKLAVLFFLILLHSSLAKSDYQKCASQVEQLFRKYSNQKVQETNGSENGLFTKLFGDQTKAIVSQSFQSELTTLDILNLESCNPNSSGLFRINAECRQSLWDLSAVLQKLFKSSDSPFFYSINLALLKYTYENSVKQQCKSVLKILNLTQNISSSCIIKLIESIMKAKRNEQQSYQQRFFIAKKQLIQSFSQCGQASLADKIKQKVQPQCQTALIQLLGEVHSLKEQKYSLGQLNENIKFSRVQQFAKNTKEVCQK